MVEPLRVTVRFANEDDCIDLFNWRNDTDTRAASFKGEEIDWGNHVRWFESVLEHQSKHLLICQDFCDPPRKIAVVRFVIEENVGVVSLNLCPSERGRGLSSECLMVSIQFLVDEGVINLGCQLRAQIKPNNRRSRRAFERAGFTVVRTDIEIVEYSLAIH